MVGWLGGLVGWFECVTVCVCSSVVSGVRSTVHGVGIIDVAGRCFGPELTESVVGRQSEVHAINALALACGMGQSEI